MNDSDHSEICINFAIGVNFSPTFTHFLRTDLIGGKLKRQESFRENPCCYNGSSQTAPQSGSGIGRKLGSTEQSDKALFICKPVETGL